MKKICIVLNKITKTNNVIWNSRPLVLDRLMYLCISWNDMANSQNVEEFIV